MKLTNSSANANSGENTTQESLDDWLRRRGHLNSENSRNWDERIQSDHTSVQCDGHVYQRERDAPGQNCVYVPPGNHNEEKYRLATFSAYPSDAPVKPADLAASGFYFTGYKDRVKCFSCGIAVENWMMGDKATDRRWHKSECAMPSGRDARNKPIPTPNFRSILQVVSDTTFGERNHVGSDQFQQMTGSHEVLGDRAEAASHRSSTAIPNDISDNLRRVNLSDSYPSLVLANVLSHEHENLLRSLNLKTEADRRKTFLKWPSYPAPFLPMDLAKEGFFYLGNLDRTQCFSCSGVLRNWAPYDGVREQHAKHFPNCRIVRLMDSGNIPLSDDQRKDADEAEKVRISALLPNADTLAEPPDPTPEEERHLAQYFPCQDPVNFHMQDLQKRTESFNGAWPRDRIRAKPEQIAKAGFFFLGEGDKTKCFYCNGGLQNWDPNDEPWTEHAKWFPGCEFVLRKKGVEFVRRLAEAHPNLNRPYIRNPVSHDIPPPPQHGGQNVTSGERSGTNLNLQAVESMGFTKRQIERAVERKRTQGGYRDTQELIDDLLDHADDVTVNGVEDLQPASVSMEQNVPAVALPVYAQAGQKREAVSALNETVTKKTRTNSPSSLPSAEDEALQRGLQELEKTSTCRVCKRSKVEIVMIPCGHLASCSGCARSTKRCPICGIKVADTVKVYRV